MSVTFHLSSWQDTPGDAPEVELAPDVVAQGLTEERLLAFPAFKNWQETLKKSMGRQKYTSHAFNKREYSLKKIDV